MLTFKHTNIFFSVVLLTLLVSSRFMHVPLFVYPMVLFIYSLIVFYGCYYIASDFFMKIHCKAVTGEKVIAISFDDGPVKEHTPKVLEILKQHNAPAAFFFIGNRVAGNEKLLQQVIDEGHLVGNHSYSHHTWFDLFSTSKVIADMKLMDETMKAVTGLKPRLFRPPYGVMNPNIKQAIVKGEYIPVGWSVRSFDTVEKDGNKLLQKMTAAIEPGAVFLFHDSGKQTISILPAFLKKVLENGYQIVALDKMLHLQPYA